LPSERAIESRLYESAASEAARLRVRLGTSDPFAIARALGVEVRHAPPRSRADADAGIRAEYLADPPTIVVYEAADEAFAVAHELFHHLAPQADNEAAARAFAVALTGEGARGGD
jgi:hypothetical protein